MSATDESNYGTHLDERCTGRAKPAMPSTRAEQALAHMAATAEWRSRICECKSETRSACRRVEQIRVASEGYFRRYATVVSVLAGSGVGSP
jgi:hypothetical protein